MKFRMWLSVITFVLLAVVVIAAWGDIKEAFSYLGRVNLWILSLIIPLQFISYLATGEMIFSYLRAKGNVRNLGVLKVTRMTLELNFVNHIFPSSGAAGAAYFSWLLSHYNVSSGRAIMAQIVRFALTFLSFVLLLLVALTVLVIDHSVDRLTILLSLLLAVLAVSATIGATYVLGSKKRLESFANWITHNINRLVRWLTRGRKTTAVKGSSIKEFFVDIHDDFLAIRRDKKILARPFLWAMVANVLDAMLIFIAFWSFGVAINPVLIFIAFGLASIAGAVVVTPGGVGIYELIMVAFLTSVGVSPTVAIAGTLLARVFLLLLTVFFGYVFYQLTVIKYGTAPTQR